MRIKHTTLVRTSRRVSAAVALLPAVTRVYFVNGWRPASRGARTRTSRRAGLFVRPDRALPAPRNQKAAFRISPLSHSSRFCCRLQVWGGWWRPRPRPRPRAAAAAAAPPRPGLYSARFAPRRRQQSLRVRLSVTGTGSDRTAPLLGAPALVSAFDTGQWLKGQNATSRSNRAEWVPLKSARAFSRDAACQQRGRSVPRLQHITLSREISSTATCDAKVGPEKLIMVANYLYSCQHAKKIVLK